jgi:hypothetical protein
VSVDADYLALINECQHGQFAAAALRVTQQLKRSDGSVTPQVMAAHLALRQAQFPKAQWLIDAALAKDPAHQGIYAEELLYTFTQNDYAKLWQQWNESVIAATPAQHPIHLLAQIIDLLTTDVQRDSLLQRLKANPFIASASHLPCFAFLAKVDLQMSALDFEAELGVKTLRTVEELIEKTDYLMALLVARLAAHLAPNDANTFAALGLAELVNGFDELADRYLHEAKFRKSSDMPLVNLYRFRIFMKQDRWANATITAKELMAQQMLPWAECLSYLDYALSKNETVQFEAGVQWLCAQFKDDARLPSTLAYLQLRQALQANQISASEGLTALAQGMWRSNACARYLTAQLLEPIDLPAAQAEAMTAIALNPYYPDAQRWRAQVASNPAAMEWMGIFIPKNHEGAAWPSAHHESLLQLIFDTPHTELAAQWNALVASYPLSGFDAGANRLLPFLHKRFETHLAPGDGSNREILKGVWKKSFFENATRLSTLLQLQTHFKNEEISLVLLKGIGNGLDLYGDLGSRPMADLDVLINPSEVTAAHQLLTRLGWLSDDPPTPPRLRFQYASTYRHPGGGMVDIHWRPCEDFISDAYDPADLGELYSITVQGQPFAVLNPTLNLLTTILHGVTWNHLPPVRWVCDARLLLHKYQAQIDWGGMLALAVKYHCLDVLVLGLQYLQQHLPQALDLPSPLKLALLSDYSQSPLIRVRTQSRSRLANADEIIATVQLWQRKLTLGAHDLVLASGGEDPNSVRARCEQHGIVWLPQYDPGFGHRHFGDQVSAYNAITIDGTHSCLMHFNSRYSPSTLPSFIHP